MGKLRIGVLRGGPSSEYEVSLKSGNTVLRTLSGQAYEVKDIFIDKGGVWHLSGRERSPADVLDHIDVAFLALHGAYGEDGQVQRLLDRFGVPYTGSRAYESALAMHKAKTKELLKDIDVKFAKHYVLTVDVDLREQTANALKQIGFPIIVKPARGGSSVGLSLARDEVELSEAIRRAFEHSNQVMLEQYIDGREATCGVIEEFRGSSLYSLLPVEIVPAHDDGLFDYDAKYSGKSLELCPGQFGITESKELQRIAREVHEKLGLRHYSRSDFLVTGNGIYFLEVNTLPGLTDESLLPKSIDAVGSSLQEFLTHVVNLAQK